MIEDKTTLPRDSEIELLIREASSEPTIIPPFVKIKASTFKPNISLSSKNDRFLWLIKPTKTPIYSPLFTTGEKNPIMDSPLSLEFCTSQTPVSPFMPLIKYGLSEQSASEPLEVWLIPLLSMNLM